MGEEFQTEAAQLFAIRFVVDGVLENFLVILFPVIRIGEDDEMIGDGRPGAVHVAGGERPLKFSVRVENAHRRDFFALLIRGFFAVLQKDAACVDAFFVGADIVGVNLFIEIGGGNQVLFLDFERPVLRFHEIKGGVLAERFELIEIAVLGTPTLARPRVFRIGAALHFRPVVVAQDVFVFPVFLVFFREIHIFPVSVHRLGSGDGDEFLEVFRRFFLNLHFIEGEIQAFGVRVAHDEIEALALLNHSGAEMLALGGREVDVFVFIEIRGAVPVFDGHGRRRVRPRFRLGKAAPAASAAAAATGEDQSGPRCRQCQKNFLFHLFRLLEK